MMARIGYKAALIAASALLAGCVSIGGGGKPPAQLLTLTADAHPGAGEARKAVAGEPVVITIPGASQTIMTNRVAVQDGPVTIAYVKDAFWVEPPVRLFHRILVDTVGAKSGRVVLDPRQSNLEPGVSLSGHLRQFGVVADAGRVVIVYDAILSRGKGKPLESRRFEASEPVAVIEAVPVGSALNRAANRVAAEIAAWIN